ncbi:MAG: undecaprenyldiphospho-muramoylpentapeptide beta-N-acetylglucosaminyltransferase [Candidatus Zixiibacteriota bacterium]
MIKVIFVGGGTGGHVFPGLAMAQEFQKRLPRARIVFVGTAKGLEADVVPKYGFQLELISIIGLSRSLNKKLILFPFYLIKGLSRSNHLLKRITPDLVVGTGGYVSWPVVFLAVLKNIPTLIQEQNSYPGITTRLLAGLVDKVCLAYQESKRYFRSRKNLKVIGNPVRRDIIKADPESGFKSFGLNPAKNTLFVFGGSQGSKTINKTVLESLRFLENEKNLQILWQTGRKDYQMIKDQMDKSLIPSAVFPFIQDMGDAYSVSDLIVSRSGALSLAEIISCKKPSLLIPYPYAANDHQRRNAEYLTKKGTSEMILEKDLDGESLARSVIDLLNNKNRLNSMRDACESLFQPRSTELLVDEMMDLLKAKNKL